MTPILLEPRRVGDDRGWFRETYVEARWRAAGVADRFVQDNQSFSAQVGTLRGIHFQRRPHAQAKLVRCVRGAILDVVVDLRAGSPTYGRHVAAELSAANGWQLYVPVGFGHAFVTLTPDTEVAYKVSDVYAPDCDGGVAWDDPQIGVDWQLPPGGPVLSAKDAALPRLADFQSPFDYGGTPLGALGEPVQV